MIADWKVTVRLSWLILCRCLLVDMGGCRCGCGESAGCEEEWEVFDDGLRFGF